MNKLKLHMSVTAFLLALVMVFSFMRYRAHRPKVKLL